MPGSPSPQGPRIAVRPKNDGTPAKAKTPIEPQTMKKPADFGKAIGIDKPANVRAKIAKWQTDLEAEVEAQAAENAVASPSTPTPTPAPAPAPTPSPKPLPAAKKPLEEKPRASLIFAPKKPAEPESSPERPKSAKKPVHNKLDEEVQIATAPKKRVISDSHWRNRAAAAGKAPPKDGTARPSPKPLPTAWVRPRPKPVEPAVPKVATPKPIVLLAPKVQPRTRSARKRRGSRPYSLGNEAQERPTSSGSGSGTDAKDEKDEKDGNASPTSPAASTGKLEPTRSRRRRRSPRTSPRNSPRGSLSAEDISAIKAKSETDLSQKSAQSRRRPRSPRASSKISPRASLSTEDITAIKSKSETDLSQDPAQSRRRRRSPRNSPKGSPRGSLSTEDVAAIRKTTAHKSETSLIEDPANKITVEYDSEPTQPVKKDTRRHSDLRERRRSRPRKDHTRNALSGPKETPVISTFQPRSRRISYQDDLEIRNAEQEPEPPVAETPPRVFGNRLEAWLQTTPDPLVEAESKKRRTSRETASTSESTRMTEISDVTASTDLSASTAEEAERSVNSRRRRRERSSTITVDTRESDDKLSSVASMEVSEPSVVEKDGELSPSLTLKRRGASSRRTTYSPTKDRVMSSPLRESTTVDDDVASSVLSSSVGASTTMELEKISLRPRPDTLATRRMFPSTGKRLSTIVSVETFDTKSKAAPSSIAEESEATSINQNNYDEEVPASEVGDQFNMDTLTTLSRKGTKRSRLASHSDLISVLSLPRAGTKSIVSARSIRTNRSRLATATISDIMSELASDEAKYMRELRTLVDGVIPVLLSCVLSKTDSAVAAGLFSRSVQTDPNNVTKPIIDMGVELERLKSLHRRVPKDNPDQFVSWAQSAQRIYTNYINVWRLGFQDVVISLAPADEDPFTPAKVVNGPDDAAPWDEGLPQNAEGYVVNGDGERVDVAYMLKRPLVRLKYLAKSLKGVNHIKPSEQSEKVADAFQDLVTAARKRSNDEYARLEDEAASNIDATRARDPRSLAPLAGVRIDPNRCVRARDHFDMHLLHSSGQEINCRVEMLIRDDPPGKGNSGDVLICEVDGTGRWLLLPPVQHGHISARNGDLEGEIVVMIRGYQAGGEEWREVFSLTSDDETAGFEWVQMLGLQPIPPQLSELKRDPSILNRPPRPTSSHASSSLVSAATTSTLPAKSRTPSPHEIEVPIGEQAKSTSKRWGYETPDKKTKSRTVSPVTPPSDDYSRQQNGIEQSPISPPSPIDSRTRSEWSSSESLSRVTSPDNNDEHDRTPRNFNEAMTLASSASPLSLKRSKAKRLSKNLSPSPTVSSRSSKQIVLHDPEEATPPRKMSKRRRSEQPHSTTFSALSQSSKGFSVWIPTSSELEYSDESSSSDDENDTVTDVQQSPPRPGMHRRASSVPSMDLPLIPKIRKTSQPTTPIQEHFEQSLDYTEPPASAPAKLQEKKRRAVKEVVEQVEDNDAPPPVPPHRSPSPATPVTLKGSKTPILTPSLPGYKTRRRSSSPLKHEYEPSTCSESSSESEEEVSEEDDVSVTSESSDDSLEDDVPTPLMPIGQIRTFAKVSPPESIYTVQNSTITPSQSASNTPYRAVPKSSGQASKSIASIFGWLDVGKWDLLHPVECSIVVTPGKVEVFEITASHSKPFLTDGDEIVHTERKTPLIAMDLTPLVPMRKSTAIDITIRSPPTSESRLKTGNNIMLRSRNPAECDQLYIMLNRSRINNPTYIALQNARGPYGQSSWAEVMDRQNAARTPSGSQGGGWLAGTLGRKNSYRKTSTRAASISAATESSVGTMNTALRSALGRFSFAKNGRFNIKSSTLGSRSTHSFDTGSSGSASGSSTPMEPGRALGAPAGITNTKCRLYERDSLTKWRDMGSARLTIMLPDPSAAQSVMRQGKGSPGVRNPMQEKRIVVVGKAKGETLLDVTLSESCFERVARSGIAISVWEDIVGPDGEVGRAGLTGGVNGTRARVFMIQMKSERECAYSFSLLGKLRY